MLKINIVRGDKDAEPVTKQISFREARKAVNGDFLIFDHDLIDIVVSREKSRLSTFPKDSITEECYFAQKSLLETLATLGVLDIVLLESNDVSPILAT